MPRVAVAAEAESASAKDTGSQRRARLWGSRFAAGPSRAVEEFTSSLAVDRRLYREDIAGSIAHARMLGTAGIIPRADAQKLIKGLQGVRKEFDDGRFDFVDGDEDIHTAIERRLHELLGADVGGKLHTGRSRNDQVALDLRMYAKNAIVAQPGDRDRFRRVRKADMPRGESSGATVRSDGGQVPVTTPATD